MQKIQYIHFLNNTELCRTGTHESYLKVSNYDITDILPLGEESQVNIGEGQTYTLKFDSVANSEYRITKLGPYFRQQNANAGDYLVIEKANDKVSMKIVKLPDQILFKEHRNKDWELLNEFLLDDTKTINSEIQVNGEYKELAIKFKHSKAKRAGSSNIFNFYDVLVGGQPMENWFDFTDYPLYVRLAKFGNRYLAVQIEKEKKVTLSW